MYKLCSTCNCYAYHFCLLAFTLSAMHHSLDICYDYNIELRILFNRIKSVRNIFKYILIISIVYLFHLSNKLNKLLQTFSHCSTHVELTLL